MKQNLFIYKANHLASCSILCREGLQVPLIMLYDFCWEKDMVWGGRPSTAAAVWGARHAQLEYDCQTDVFGARNATKERQTVPGTVLYGSFSYENHINTETAKVEWTIEEELLLIQYHNDIGNKWSVIAQKIPGKYHNTHSGPTTASRTTSTLSCAKYYANWIASSTPTSDASSGKSTSTLYTRLWRPARSSSSKSPTVTLMFPLPVDVPLLPHRNTKQDA